SSSPAEVRISAPNSSRSCASPGVPGSTTARAMASASMRWAPSSANMVAIVDLPEPMPPVSPMCSMRVVLPCSVLAAGRQVQILRAGHGERHGAVQCLGTRLRRDRLGVRHVHEPGLRTTRLCPLSEVEEHAVAHIGTGAHGQFDRVPGLAQLDRQALDGEPRPGGHRRLGPYRITGGAHAVVIGTGGVLEVHCQALDADPGAARRQSHGDGDIRTLSVQQFLQYLGRAVVGDGELGGDQTGAALPLSLPLLGKEPYRRHRGILLTSTEGLESGDQCRRTHPGDSTGPPVARLTAPNIQKWWVSLANTHHFWMFGGERDGGGAGRGTAGARGEGRRVAGCAYAAQPTHTTVARRSGWSDGPLWSTQALRRFTGSRADALTDGLSYR